MKKFKCFFIFLCSLLTVVSFVTPMTLNGLVFTQKDNSFLLYLVFVIFLFLYYKKYLYSLKYNKIFNFLSLLFSLFMVVGYSFDVTDSSDLLFGSWFLFFLSLLKIVGYFIFFNVTINVIFNFIKEYDFPDFVKKNKLLLLFEKNPFLFSCILLLICYLPYMIAYYPAVINYDAANQIKEVMGIHTRYMDSVVLINENVFITNFNPVIHTLLLGGLFKLGYNLGSVNFGLFLYSVFQTALVIMTFSYAICFMKKQGIKSKYLIISLLIFALVPVFPMYAMTTVKDVIFSCLILLLVIYIYKFIINDILKRDYFIFFVIVLFMMLFRNNGLYILLLVFPFMIIVLKDKRKSLVSIFVLSLISYFGYNRLLTYFEITNTSIREALSIPFQQTARLVKYKEEVIEETDKNIIDVILDYNTLADRYEPDLSDNVKNKYNKYATSDDLKRYFIVWFKYLLKEPMIYVDATLNNVYGYFYPNTAQWYLYNDYNTKLEEAGFDYHFNNLDVSRDILGGFSSAYSRIPFLGLIVNIGFTSWIYLFMLCSLIVTKNKKYIFTLLPGFVLLLTCIAGPANTYFRYILPLTFTLPVMVPLLLKKIRYK